MHAQNTRDDLERQRQVRLERVRALERERAGLVLDASMGDAKARNRMKVVRSEIADHSAAISDLVESIADLEPVVVRELLAAARADRRAAVAHFDQVVDQAKVLIGRVDAAILALRDAFQAAHPVIEQARTLGAHLLMQDASGDVGTQASNRMLAMDSSALRPFEDQVGEKLSDLQVVAAGVGGQFRPLAGSLVENFAVAVGSLRCRVEDRLADDDAAEEREAA